MGRTDMLGETEDSLAAGRYLAQLRSSMRGRPGQAALRGIREAMLKLPERRLTEGALVSDGQVCAIGALAVQRYMDDQGVDRAEALKRYGGYETPYDIQPVANELGIKWAMMNTIMEANDEAYTGYSYRRPMDSPPVEVQEQKRWQEVMDWLNKVILWTPEEIAAREVSATPSPTT